MLEILTNCWYRMVVCPWRGHRDLYGRFDRCIYCATPLDQPYKTRKTA